jgi:hypothetical protein
MPAPLIWRRYLQASSSEDRLALGALMIPALLCLSPVFSSGLPPWVAGFGLAVVAFRYLASHPRLGWRLFALLFVVVVIANALLQHSYLSSAWTYRIIGLLWFLLGSVAGLHFWGTAAQIPEEELT